VFKRLLWFRQRFDFYQMLLDQARKSEEGLQALCKFMDDGKAELGQKVERTETEADELRRQLIDALNRTFVTPIDREDIFALSRAVDDMVDYAKSTVEEMMLFQVKPNEHLRKMADALYQASKHITLGVGALRKMPNGMHEHIIRAKKTENLMEHLYREALVELFKDKDVVNLLKMREIYRHLNNAADRGDEAADILSDILVKNT
jgi:predicted phosphate transport protein (TIGR00153 family)